MKKMTCKQLGGACEAIFTATTFEEMASLSQEHCKKMVLNGDNAHKIAMDKMKSKMQNVNEMNEWMQKKRREFDELPS